MGSYPDSGSSGTPTINNIANDYRTIGHVSNFNYAGRRGFGGGIEHVAGDH